MSKRSLYLWVGVVSIFAMLFVASPVMAWAPQASIRKKVQNETTNSVLADANDANSLIVAKPGNILRYEITIQNTGDTDVVDAVMKDTLPQGVELVDNASKRSIEEKIGTLQPGKKVTKTYKVKVTSTKDQAILDNQACLSAKEIDQTCDSAKVKVQVPEKPAPETPQTTTPPSSRKNLPTGGAKSAPLPQSGPGAVVGTLVATTALAYAIHLYLRSRQGLAAAWGGKK